MKKLTIILSIVAVILLLSFLAIYIFNCVSGGKDDSLGEDNTLEENASPNDNPSEDSNKAPADSNNAPIDSNNSSQEIEKDNTPFKTLTYIAFGDSITFGADYTKGYAQMDDPYPELVSKDLEMESYINYGISGATLASNTLGLVCMSNQVISYTASHDVISLMGGVNDYNRNIPLGTVNDTENNTIYGALNVIAATLTSRFPDSFIFFMTPYKEAIGGNDCLADNAEGYNLSDVAAAVKQVAKKYNIPVLDMYNEGQYELEMYKPESDGIHPSQEFIKEYTVPQIAEFIRDNYQ